MPKSMFTPIEEWQQEVSKVLLQLIQEAHVHNPGLKINADLTIIIAAAQGGED